MEIDNKVFEYINEMTELTSYQDKDYALSKLIEEVNELKDDLDNKKYNDDNFFGEMADVIYCIFCYCNQFNCNDKLLEQLKFKLDRQFVRELEQLKIKIARQYD